MAFIVSACAGIKPADSFYQSCAYYLDSIADGDSEDLILRKVDGYFQCGSSSLSAYCQTANCSNVAEQFNEKMLAHQSKLHQLQKDGSTEEDAEIWLGELMGILQWYEQNETAFTKEDARQLAQNLNAAAAELNRQEMERINEFNQQMGANRGNYSTLNTNSASTAMVTCKLVRSDAGKTSSGSSLFEGTGVKGVTEPTVCTYECSNGTTKQRTTRGTRVARP